MHSKTIFDELTESRLHEMIHALVVVDRGHPAAHFVGVLKYDPELQQFYVIVTSVGSLAEPVPWRYYLERCEYRTVRLVPAIFPAPIKRSRCRLFKCLIL